MESHQSLINRGAKWGNVMKSSSCWCSHSSSGAISPTLNALVIANWTSYNYKPKACYFTSLWLHFCFTVIEFCTHGGFKHRLFESRQICVFELSSFSWVDGQRSQMHGDFRSLSLPWIWHLICRFSSVELTETSMGMVEAAPVRAGERAGDGERKWSGICRGVVLVCIHDLVICCTNRNNQHFKYNDTAEKETE